MTVAHCQFSIARRLHHKWYWVFQIIFLFHICCDKKFYLIFEFVFLFQILQDQGIAGRRGGEDSSQYVIFSHVNHEITNCHDYVGRFVVEDGDVWLWVYITDTVTHLGLYLWLMILWIRVKSESWMCSLCLPEQLPRDALSYIDLSLLKTWPKPQVPHKASWCLKAKSSTMVAR